MREIKVIAFDADDTLWVNEPLYKEMEHQFCDLLASYLPQESISEELFKIEMQNLALYGYGAKSFMLSMIETISKVAGPNANIQLVNKTIELGKQMLEQAIELIEGVEETLQQLNGDYTLVLATKGDLLDQERKLINSGLEKYFHHIEVMSDKKIKDYQKLLRHLDITPEKFLMIGNSLRSDVIPPLELGSYAIHVPFPTTWAYENVDQEIEHPKFHEVEKITEILNILKS